MTTSAVITGVLCALMAVSSCTSSNRSAEDGSPGDLGTSDGGSLDAAVSDGSARAPCTHEAQKAIIIGNSEVVDCGFIATRVCLSSASGDAGRLLDCVHGALDAGIPFQASWRLITCDSTVDHALIWVLRDGSLEGVHLREFSDPEHLITTLRCDPVATTHPCVDWTGDLCVECGGPEEEVCR